MSVQQRSRDNWLLGNDSTAGDKAIVAAACVIGLVGVFLANSDWRDWSVLAVAVMALFTVDVVGGVVANGLPSAASLYGSSERRNALERVLKNTVAFSALHVHTFVIVLLIPDAHISWAVYWYVACLAGTIMVRAARERHALPVAMGWCALAIIVSTVVSSPDGLAWFGPVLCIKLVLAHALTPSRAAEVR